MENADIGMRQPQAGGHKPPEAGRSKKQVSPYSFQGECDPNEILILPGKEN